MEEVPIRKSPGGPLERVPWRGPMEGVIWKGSPGRCRLEVVHWWGFPTGFRESHMEGVPWKWSHKWVLWRESNWEDHLGISNHGDPQEWVPCRESHGPGPGGPTGGFSCGPKLEHFLSRDPTRGIPRGYLLEAETWVVSHMVSWGARVWIFLHGVPWT